jgi:oligopeptidase B
MPVPTSTSAPSAKTQPHAFSHHGITVNDPYAWLRDAGYPTVEDPEILAYLEAENAYFDAYMQPLQPLVDELFEEMKGRRPAQEESVPYEKNGYWYQWRFNENAQYRTWYRAARKSPNEWDILFDECALAADLDYFSLGALAVSPDGNKLAFSVDTDGSERYTLQVVDLRSGEVISPLLENTMGTPVWNTNSSALLYVVLNEQWQPLTVYRHTLGSDQGDALVFEEPDTAYRVSLELTQSETFVLINSSAHSDNEIYLIPRASFETQPKLMEPRKPNVEYYVDHGNAEFLIRSNLRQQNFDLFTAPEQQPDQANWTLWLAGDTSCYITGHLKLANYVIVEERIQGLDQIRVIAADHSQHHIRFPETAYEASLGTNPNFDCDTLRLGYTSMVTPQTVYEYDLRQRKLTELKVQQIPSGYNPEEFVTERRFAPTRDGVEVPVSLVYHKETPLDGSAPLYLYAYGAYGYATPPAFSASRISLLERGYIYAVAHIRGGDDLGYHWYADGKLDKRTNTFNDFVDAAQYLISENLGRPGHIAIAGGSAGGELMGAVVNQAPQLWGAVAAHVPFVDVLNTMLDATLPLTPPEWGEWGNPIEDADAFKLIQSYSPYDQLQPGHYPPMLVTAGLNDPRVTYWEPAKYVAKLRSLKQDQNVVLLKTNMGAGHGGQSGRYDALKELAEEYAFFLVNLGQHKTAETGV